MRKIIISFIILISVVSCEKEEFDIINLNDNKIIALGHAGMGSGDAYPMNSYESILKCLNFGMDGTELDVQMTKDSVLVAYHDQDLSENSNIDGIINSLNWYDIKNAYYTQTPYLNYSIISLEELFSNIDDLHKYKFTFDCKLYTNNINTNQFYTSYINAVVKLIQKYNLENNVYIESQSEVFLRMFKNLDPNYKLFIYSSSFESGLDIALSLDLFGLTMSIRDISKDQIEIAHNNNLWVAIWNIHSESDNIEAIHKNPDFIQTNEVRSLIELIK